MDATRDAIAAVSQRLDGFFALRIAEVTEIGAHARDLAEAAASATSGGKRLRAAFCYWGWRAGAGDARSEPPAAVVDTSAALEIFQAAALVHDDLIDNSDTRRGAPSAHRRLEHAHRTRSWSGDSPTHGRAAALLLGDLLVAWSDDLFEEGLTHCPEPIARKTRSEYARMRSDVTLGQYLDIAEESAFPVSPIEGARERALTVAAYKSARYSVVQPLVLGGALAGGDDALLEDLRAFGHPLGMAFQLRDDVLGVFGDPTETGKPAGDDLREGKRTVLIATTRERLDDPDAERMDTLLGNRFLDEVQIRDLQAMIRDSGALDATEQMIADYAAQAESAAASPAWSLECRAAFGGLLERTVNRSR